MRELTQEDIDSGALIDIDEFIGDCVQGAFIDYDGFGYFVYNDDEIEDGKNAEIAPSDIVNRTNYPSEDVTHILWFNR